MNLIDIIALAKAGYKKADIDELLAVPVDEPEPLPAAPDSTVRADGPEGGPEPSPEDSPQEPDYRMLYDDIQKELEKVRQDLKAAQEKNITKDLSGQAGPDPMKELEDVFRSYM